MKKYLLLASVAALAFTSCSDQSTEFVGDSAVAKQTREITIAPIAKPTTRTAVLDNVFPTGSDIIVSAWDKTNGRNFFEGVTFKYQYAGGSSTGSGSTWGAETTPIYWPLSPTTINFLAYAQKTGSAADTWTNAAQQVVIQLADNSSTQNDLMYAVGQGKVQQNGNALIFPADVNMVFKHSQALMQFYVKGTAVANGKITIKKITLNNAYFSGTLTVDNSANYNVETAPVDPTATWSSIGSQKAALDLFNGSYVINTTATKKAEVMVVPQDAPTVSFDSFTITYTLDSKDYTYTYTPDVRVMYMATKYVYDITFNLNEIFISPSVTEWTETATNYVDIPSVSFVAPTGGTYNVAAAAGTYTIYVTGLTASDGLSVAETGGSAYIDTVTTDATADANGVAKIVFTMKANTGASRNTTITLTDSTDGSKTTAITISQAAGA